MHSIIILIKSPDQKGLVAKVCSFVYEQGFNVLDCQQHVDIESNDFFMRLKLELDSSSLDSKIFEKEFQLLANKLILSWSIHYTKKIEKVAILVGKTSHCLYDLLVRQKEKEIRCEIPIIISNHDKLKPVADQFGIEFHHLPIRSETKVEQEKSIRDLLIKNKIDLVILARYMRILSKLLAEEYFGKIINIHHAFLPAFQGAKPYQRAYERGVKIIGATAHYVTSELDEGPIIQQDVEHVTHEDSPQDLRQIGRDIERVVLAKAIKAHLERRVIVTGRRTIVFSA